MFTHIYSLLKKRIILNMLLCNFFRNLKYIKSHYTYTGQMTTIAFFSFLVTIFEESH